MNLTSLITSRLTCGIFYRYGVGWLIFAAVSCIEDNPAPVATTAPDGYFIINEGAFGNANTSLSYYDRQSDTIMNNIFQSTNGRPLGDQTQSMSVFEGRGYIIVQNSAKVEIINREDFTTVATLGPEEGIESPRYFLGLTPAKGYLTDWGADGLSGTLKILDLTEHTVTATLPLGQGPNQLIMHDDRVYVAHSGGFGHDSTLYVIDPERDIVTDTLVVGDNPNSLAIDSDGALWVAGGGHLVYNEDYSVNEAASTPGFIARLENGEFAWRANVVESGTGPYDLTMHSEQQTLYFRYSGEIYEMDPADILLPTMPLIPGNFYGLSVDPRNGEIVTTSAPDFSSPGTFSRFTSTGQPVRAFTVGIAPNGFAF